MCGEHCAYLRTMLFKVKDTATRHPLVEVCHYLVARRYVVVVVALYHLAGSMAKQHRLYIVPLSAKAVQTIHFPIVREDNVFLMKQVGKVHQKHNRLAHDIPPPYLYVKPTAFGIRTKTFVQRLVFQKFAIAFLVPIYIGTYKNIIIIQILYQSICFGGQHGVDATYFVANLPTCFKQKISSHSIKSLCN